MIVTNKMVILLHGPMGSGKTTLSKLLHERIKPSARVALPDIKRIVSGGQPNTADIARTIMLQMSRTYLQNDIPVIIEVVCKADYIAACETLAVEEGCAFLPYFVSADEKVRWERVCDRTAEMMGVENLPKTKLAELQPIFAHNKDFYDGLDGELGVYLDTSDLTAEEVLKKIHAAIQEA
jgi:predicted ABC-type ATPase